MTLEYTPHERINLKSHPILNEQWLQDRIADDPAILGLGDLAVLERERPQYNAGRLDLLLSDGDGQRFEVELQLGKSDASHIIRTIEYWDIERRRYPGHDHCAVIVAEDITSRFLNVIALFAGSIPLVAIQLSAIKIGEQITLHFTKVLDQRHLRVDDENPEIETAVDRSYWESRASQKTMQLCDRLLDIVNEQAGAQHQLAYLKRRIGLSDGARYIRFFPRKEHVRILVRVPDAPAWKSRCEADELDTDVSRRGNLRFNVTPASLETHRDILVEMIRSAVEEQEA